MHAGVGTAAVKTDPGLFSANDYFSPRTPSTPSVQDPVAIANDADPDGENAAAVSKDGTIVSQITKKESIIPSVDDFDHVVRPNFKRESSLSNSDSKRSLTPRKSATPVSLKKGVTPVQLIADLPRAERAAFATFERLETNWHQYKTLGRSKVQEDAMSCECQFRLGVDDLDRACGANSDCINRLTQVECLEGECRCRQYCQNQRFQKQQYADIHIVQTEKKGFGLRAGSDIKRDDFIYEYIGEVVSQPSFLKRMRNYADEGIKHFYFMMLQKDEFIDATKKGDIGRFANHSCNPNCYVAKWVVHNRLRMGIFAKRDIKKDEELTFNYNVDRYGNDAQICYCGEPNCVGFIGGKTQTDLGGMDDLYMDALGITDEVELLNLKGTRKKKSRNLDEDYMPILKPMMEKEVPKVINAIRQTTSRKILQKLLQRIKMTDDQDVLRQVTRLRGLTLMTPTLKEYKDDIEIQTLILENIQKWPFVNRTKVEDSKIEPIIEAYTRGDNEDLKTLSEQILMQWSVLEAVYRIRKRALEDDEAAPQIILAAHEEDTRPTKRLRIEEVPTPVIGKSLAIPTQRTPPRKFKPLPISTPSSVKPSKPAQPSRDVLDAIIAQANEAARQLRLQQEEEVKANAEEEARKRDRRETRKQRSEEKRARRRRGKEKAKGKECAKGGSENEKDRERKHKSSSSSKSERDAKREKQLLKLVGAAVVGYLSQHRQHLDNEQFKRHAKELTHTIAELEKKGATYRSGAKLEALSDEKRAKIKKYIKSYVGKLLKRPRDSSKGETNESSTSRDPRVLAAERTGFQMNGTSKNGHSRDVPMEIDMAADLGLLRDDDVTFSEQEDDGSDFESDSGSSDEDDSDGETPVDDQPSAPALNGHGEFDLVDARMDINTSIG